VNFYSFDYIVAPLHKILEKKGDMRMRGNIDDNIKMLKFVSMSFLKLQNNNICYFFLELLECLKHFF